MLFDTHAHLNDDRLAPEIESIVAGMREKGISHVMNVGYDTPSSIRAVEQSTLFDNVYASVGIHPHDSKSATKKDYDLFVELAKNSKVKAYGEIGLDFYYDLSERDVQERVFIEQLELASTLKLPVIFHVRDAYGLAYEILKAHKNLLDNGGVMHCYQSSKEMLPVFLDLGLHIAFGGAITFKNAKKEDVVKAVPIDRLLLETDCPYMTPVPFRGKTNYPEYVALVRDKICEWRNEDIETITTQNAKRVFRIE